MKSKGYWLLAGILATLIGIGLLAAACGDGGGADEQVAVEEDEHAADAQEAAVQGEAEEYVVVATEFAFEPSEITVKKGQAVKLVLQNDGKVEHDYEVMGLHAQMMEEMHAHEDGHGGGEMVHVHAMPGEAEHIEFIPEESGTYEIVCTIPGHAEAGMVGTLIVQ